MKIPLDNGQFAIVDDCDSGPVLSRKWRTSKNGHGGPYAITGNSSLWIVMHHVITGERKQIDHINGDGLDNRRSNLRFADHSQNAGNSDIDKSYCSSQYRGVTWNIRGDRWIAQIGSGRQGTRQYIGCFTDEIEAALAYDQAALKRWGDFARLNFPRTG